MRFPLPLIKGKLIKRYKRFLSDIELEDGRVVTAHCVNPGAMLGIKDPGTTVWIQPVPEISDRKLRYTWELVEMDGHFIGANTSHPNKIVYEALEKNHIPELDGYQDMKREVKYGENSRVDILLSDPEKGLCYVEVKNAHLKRDDLAQFPDSVTTRGAKHLGELAKMVEQGHRAVLLYVVQRQDCSGFSLAGDIDPAYAAAAKEAKEKGLEFLCYQCKLDTDAITLDKPLPFHKS